MSERPWMPLYINDFMLDTVGLELDEVGVYITMICLAWRRGDGSVSGDMKELKAVLQQLAANLHGLTFNRIVPKLLARYFEKREDGRFYQKRVEKELRKARELSENNSRIARERWAGNNKNKGLAYANAVPSQSQSQSHKKEREGVVRLREGGEFIEVESPEWEAWSSLRHWPQADFRVDGRIRRGWWFSTRWPSSELPKANGRSAPLAQEAG